MGAGGLDPHEGAGSADAARWARVKALWFDVHDLPVAERDERLADAGLDAFVRDEVRRLLAAAASVGDRFETPAAVALGSAPFADASALAEAPTLVGRRLGPFRVLRRIGEGGMGAVYEAVRDDAAYEQRVAIKSLWRGADCSLLLQRFRTERQILAGLRHPHIAQLLDGGSTAEGTPWLALEYVDGRPIDAWCDDTRLGLPARLDLFRQVCAAVHFAHRQLVVHRDLKPSNVFVGADGTVKLLDFGVAKLLDPTGGDGTLTQAGLAPFTAAYAAPEQVTGAPISVATDVYALGALLVQLLTGRPPLDVQGLSGQALTERITRDAAAAPSARVRALDAATAERVATARGFASAARLAQALDGELDAIALMALRKEPERRYASAEALSDDVRRFLRRDRVLARPDTLGYRLRARARRRPALATGLAVGALALCVVGGVRLEQRAAQERERARTERVARFMAGLVAGPDLAAGDPLVRIGPRGTVAELLDDAIARVPREFADDARSRVRLYTAIGTNLAAQERLADAERLLDSAVTLAATAHAPSEEPAALAALELARVRFMRGGPAAARPTLDPVLRVVGERGSASRSLRAGALLLDGRVRRAEGDVRAADAIARRVLAMDADSSAPRDMTTVRALLLLAITEAWIARDPRAYVRRCRHAAALTDSIGGRLSSERLEATLCEVDGLVTLGRHAEADSLLRATRAWYESAYGGATSSMATLLAQSANVSALRGDTASQRTLMADAQRILDASGDVSAEQVVGIASVLVEQRRAAGDLDGALLLARNARDRARPHGVPLATIVAEFTVARVEVALGDLPAAAASLERGLAAFPPSGDLDSYRPLLLRLAVAVAETRGDSVAADSLRGLLPAARGPVPDCTPGGRWVGCPVE